MRAFDFAANQPWVIQEEGLKLILEIAQRNHEPDFEAVAQKIAERSENNQLLQKRDGVAILNVVGPIVRYANIFTMISGGTSVSELATGFRAALDDSSVRGIVLNFDSPGGEVAGISELASVIYESRGKKPVVAYVDDLAASGAYWLASATDRIVASDTARLGSIGVVATIVDRSEQSESRGVRTYQFVSSVSPKKRPDLKTEEGKATVQEMVEDLASVFVESVARNRSVSREKVISDFGQGGILIAKKAIAAGMADSIGNFESLIASLGGNSSHKSIHLGGSAASKSKEGMISMSDEKKPAAETQPQVDISKIQSEAYAAERKRISTILMSDEAKGREKMALTVALDGERFSAESALRILSNAPKEEKNSLAAAMEGVPNPEVGAQGGENGETATLESEIKKTLALVEGN